MPRVACLLLVVRALAGCQRRMVRAEDLLEGPSASGREAVLCAFEPPQYFRKSVPTLLGYPEMRGAAILVWVGLLSSTMSFPRMRDWGLSMPPGPPMPSENSQFPYSYSPGFSGREARERPSLRPS